MWYETWNTTIPTFPQLLSTTYYVYEYDSTDDARTGRSDGNPTRIITEYPAASGQQASAAQSGTVGTTVESSTAAPSVDSGAAVSAVLLGEGEAAALLGPGGGGGCGTGKPYTAIRLGYAINGRTVTYAHDEEWCWDGVAACPTNYSRTWAREFRYDGARARYMNRPLNPTTLAPSLTKPVVWTDYDGDEPYRDYAVTAGAAVPGDAFQPGLWRNMGGVSAYLHSDHLGTLRNTSDIGADPGSPRVFTAFGERIAGPTDRHGYVGAFGYQSHPEEPGLPFLHVGARYYDPATGRFLQRDPIGIMGGTNVHAYVGSAPSARTDPSGLVDQNWEPPHPPLPPNRVNQVPDPPAPDEPSDEPTLRDRVVGAAKDGTIGAVSGALIGAVKGGVGGAGVGALVGGVGAGPGAVAGAIGGGIVGYLEGLFLGLCTGFMFP